MGTLLESKEALRARALEVHLTETEVEAIIANGVTSLARLAFAASQPGTTPTDDQVAALFGAGIVPNVGTLASIKRLVFEAQTLVIADVKKPCHQERRCSAYQYGSRRARKPDQ